jgi:hypothetical protein
VEETWDVAGKYCGAEMPIEEIKLLWTRLADFVYGLDPSVP